MFAAGKTKGASASAAANYIEDVFSTWLYTGNSSTQTITNGIDLAGKGGLVWLKSRSQATDHRLVTTTLGASNDLSTDLTAGLDNNNIINAFNSNGFTLNTGNDTNINTYTYVSWTFREQPKFFDVVTGTLDSSGNITVNHSLGADPGCVFIKETSAVSDWLVYHQALGTNQMLYLNATSAAQTLSSPYGWASTSTTFTANVGFDPGAQVVLYLFAHNAGGFGLTGTDNVISCGSYAGSSGDVTVTLGYEPQWVMIKPTTTASGWVMMDSMRGMPVGGQNQRLYANASNSENAGVTGPISPTATGFTVSPTGIGWNNSGQTYIYIAIRRGPMKVPTDGTKVFGLNARSGTGANATVTGGQVDDAVLIKNRGSAVADLMSSRLTGKGYLVTSSTAAEVAAGTTILQANPWDVMDGVKVGTTSTITNASSNTFINYLFRRAPGFFDEVCYTGNGSTQTVSHNLGVAPEMMIVKSRSAAYNWPTYHSGIGNNAWILLNSLDPISSPTTLWNATSPTASVFTIGNNVNTNDTSQTYVAYLFASCPDVSKVGSYTGNGTTQTINCGFAGGARFVLIKRTDSTGDWYVYDTARGMTTLTDPYLRLNSTAAESATLGSVTTVTTGFAVNASILAAINTNGASYIFLAIA